MRGWWRVVNHLQVPAPDFDRLLIFGAGGFGREVAWLVRQCWGDRIELCFIVDRPQYLVDHVGGIPVRMLGDCTYPSDTHYVAAVGEPSLRKTAAAACEARSLTPATLVHPRVEASESVVAGLGSVICAGSILTVDVELGIHVQVNLGCTLGHDVKVGDFSTLSPGAHVSGNVRIGNGVYIGTGANIINGHPDRPLVIGDGAVVAAGACVTRAVEPFAMVAGVPAVRKR